MKRVNSLDRKEKKVVMFIGFKTDDQLKRILRFLAKHGVTVYAVNNVEKVRMLKKAEKDEKGSKI